MFELHPGDEFELGLLAEVRAIAGQARRVGGPDWEWLRTSEPPHRFATLREGNDLVAYAELRADSEGILIDGPLIAPRKADAPDLLESLLDAVLLRDTGVDVGWWIESSGIADQQAASSRHLLLERELLQLRVSLPLDLAWGGIWRSFKPDTADAADWVTMNNRAFAGHPDQGFETLDTLLARTNERWFDPEGFLLHHIDGRLAASCWTKIHDDQQPPLGEIYIIGVDPDFQGRKLGWALTVSGLEHLFSRGCHQGMLYVESDNTAARKLYESLGFSEHHRDRHYVRRAQESTAQGDPSTPSSEPTA